MVNILERTADLGARDVVNFVGLAWRAGELAALEGKDCYFIDPHKHCLYYNIRFPRGGRANLATIIYAYQQTSPINPHAPRLLSSLAPPPKVVFGFLPHTKTHNEQ